MKKILSLEFELTNQKFAFWMICLKQNLHKTKFDLFCAFEIRILLIYLYFSEKYNKFWPVQKISQFS